MLSNGENTTLTPTTVYEAGFVYEHFNIYNEIVNNWIFIMSMFFILIIFITIIKKIKRR